MALLGAIGLVVGLFVLPASAEDGNPVFVPGNPHCDDIKVDAGELPGIGETESYDGSTEVDGETVPVRINVTRTGEYTFDWESVDPEDEDDAGFGIGTVYVKGGPNANGYFYDPPATEDQGLTTPTNPNNDKPYGISHISFCLEDIEPPDEPGSGSLRVVKVVDDGQEEEDLDPFAFQVECGDFDSEALDEEDRIRLGDEDDWSESFEDGTECTITETVDEDEWDTSYATNEDPVQEGDDTTVIVTIVEDETITVTFTNARDGDPPPPPPGNGGFTPTPEETTTTTQPDVVLDEVVEQEPVQEPEEEPAVEETTTTTEEEVDDVVEGVEVARELPRTGDALQTGTLLVFAGLALLLGGLALGYSDRSVAVVGRRD